MLGGLLRVTENPLTMGNYTILGGSKILGKAGKQEI